MCNTVIVTETVHTTVVQWEHVQGNHPPFLLCLFFILGKIFQSSSLNATVLFLNTSMSCQSVYHIVHDQALLPLTSPHCFRTCPTDENPLHDEGGVHRCVSVSFPCACVQKPEPQQQQSNPDSLLRHKAAAICSCTYNHLLALSAKVVDHCLKVALEGC